MIISKENIIIKCKNSNYVVGKCRVQLPEDEALIFFRQLPPPLCELITIMYTILYNRTFII